VVSHYGSAFGPDYLVALAVLLHPTVYASWKSVRQQFTMGAVTLCAPASSRLLRRELGSTTASRSLAAYFGRLLSPSIAPLENCFLALQELSGGVRGARKVRAIVFIGSKHRRQDE